MEVGRLRLGLGSEGLGSGELGSGGWFGLLLGSEELTLGGDWGPGS